jgi:hypothetical protein
MSPGVAFKEEDVPELPDQTKQKHYHSFVAKLQVAATWIRFDISFALPMLLYRSWHVFVHQRVRRNGQLSTFSENILQYTPTSRSSIAGVQNQLTFCLDMQMQTGAIVHPAN